MTIEAKEKKVQRILDEFWRDRDNHMDTRVESLCTELSLYGEQFIRFFVNPLTGRVKIAQIDPSLIDQIETDIDNVEHALRFHQRPVGPGGALWSATAPIGGVAPGQMVGGGRGGIINAPQESAYAPTMEPGAIYAPGDQVMAGVWYDAGTEVVQFKINSVSNAKRGKSELATLLPWLRRYQEWLIDRVRVNKYKAAFLWDIKLSGADAKTIERKRMQYALAPSPGSVVVHNESEEWSAVQPKIEADDVASDGHAIKMMIAMGAGLPQHYLAEGGDVNRATAAEMGLPTYRRLKRRQEQFRLMLSVILDRVLDEAVRAVRLSDRVDRTYVIELPEITPSARATPAPTATTTAATGGTFAVKVQVQPDPTHDGTATTVSATTTAGASCTVQVVYASGSPSGSASLKTTQTAGSDRTVSWTWKPSTSRPGPATATVNCTYQRKSATGMATFTVAS